VLLMSWDGLHYGVHYLFFHASGESSPFMSSLKGTRNLVQLISGVFCIFNLMYKQKSLIKH